MMLKVVIYGYMNNLYSCRKIESALKRDIHFIWLAGYEQPDFNNFGSDKVKMDFAFFAIAFNLKKMCSTMTRQNWASMEDFVQNKNKLRTLP